MLDEFINIWNIVFNEDDDDFDDSECDINLEMEVLVMWFGVGVDDDDDDWYLFLVKILGVLVILIDKNFNVGNYVVILKF